MSDLKKVTDELAAKAALAAGKDAAKRAVADLFESDEDKTKKEAERSEASKKKRTKYIAYAVVALLLVLGLVGLVLSYWQYFLLAGLLGVAGLYGYWRLRKRLRASGEEPEQEEKAAPVANKIEKKAEPAPEPTRIDTEALRREQAEKRAREARALEEARAVEAQAIDDELAAMKAKLKRE